MRIVTCFFFALVCLRADSKDEILNRMDADSAKFHGVKAHITYVEFSPVLKESTTSDIDLTLVKLKKNVTALLDYTKPDPKQWLMKEGIAYEYLPKVPQINEYDTSKYSSMVNQFLTLAFGSSGQDLKKNYKISEQGSSVLGDSKVTKLLLEPLKKEALDYMKKIEFWVPEGKSYAVQVKIYQPSGDTNTATYSAINLNPAGLNEHDVVLKAPKNVKIEKINK